ncbi:hypothetical protein O6H91_Y048100 [Diphasiastrum complanatum]|nr:hypothetical protein O6H91_Y048100 [Diphasiastrum complanatum]
MHAGDGEDEIVRDNEIPTTAAGLPWWNGVGAAKTEKPVYGQLPTDVSVASKAVTFVLPSHVQHSQPQVLAQTQLDNQEGRKPTSSSSQPLPAQPGFDENGQDEHLRQQQGTTAGIPPPPGEYILPHTQLGLGQSLVRTAYPYADPYFGGIVAAYGAQAMIHPHMLGVQQARMPLPSEIVEEEPVYVNAKQYHGILRRRQIRAKAESENKLIKTRKVGDKMLSESKGL